MILLGLSALLISITLCAAGYLFAAYVMFRVGEKFRVGRFATTLCLCGTSRCSATAAE